LATTEAVETAIWLTRVTLDDYDVRGALILGDERAVVWDTLSRPGDMRPFLPLIGNRELVIVYSHADWDHIWGTAGLDYEGITIVGHERCAERFANDVPIVLAKKRTRSLAVGDDVVIVPPTKLSFAKTPSSRKTARKSHQVTRPRELTRWRSG
jgi:glyoxylase-like metal-dependent hydrolase (beta-lactamase superfamily II)